MLRERSWSTSERQLSLNPHVSKEDPVIQFNKLSDMQKATMAKRSGMTIDECRRWLEEGFMQLNDASYSNVDLAERKFHIIGDTIFQDTIEAARTIGDGDAGPDDGLERVFGLLPLGELNAISYFCAGRGYIIAVNYLFFLFLTSLSVLVNKFWEKFLTTQSHRVVIDAIENYMGDYNPRVNRWERRSIWDAFDTDAQVNTAVESCIDQKMHSLFIFTMLQYAFTTLPDCDLQKVALDFTEDDKLDYLISQGGLGGILMADILSFILCHEYAHGSRWLASVREEADRDVREEADRDRKTFNLSDEDEQSMMERFERMIQAREHLDESLADSMGFDLCFLTIARRYSRSGRRIANDALEALERAFFAASAHMSCGKLLSAFMSAIDQSAIDQPLKRTHPPFWVRQQALEAKMLMMIGDPSKPQTMEEDRIFRLTRSRAVLFERFVDVLWKSNKNRITSGLRFRN